jgi:hypothetical protein
MLAVFIAGMGPSTLMQMDFNTFNCSVQQPGAPDDVINNCGAPAMTAAAAAADSSAMDSDDDGGSSGSDTAAQLLLQFAADHKHQKQYELNSTDDTRSWHRRHSKGGLRAAAACCSCVTCVLQAYLCHLNTAEYLSSVNIHQKNLGWLLASYTLTCV